MPERNEDVESQAADEIQAKKPSTVDFTWHRRKVFDRHVALLMLEKIQDEEEAVIVEINQSCKTKKKPIPLNTIAM